MKTGIVGILLLFIIGFSNPASAGEAIYIGVHGDPIYNSFVALGLTGDKIFATPQPLWTKKSIHMGRSGGSGCFTIPKMHACVTVRRLAENQYQVSSSYLYKGATTSFALTLFDNGRSCATEVQSFTSTTAGQVQNVPVTNKSCLKWQN